MKAVKTKSKKKVVAPLTVKLSELNMADYCTTGQRIVKRIFGKRKRFVVTKKVVLDMAKIHRAEYECDETKGEIQHSIGSVLKHLIGAKLSKEKANDFDTTFCWEDTPVKKLFAYAKKLGLKI